MICPYCARPDLADDLKTCPHCGVVFAKIHAPRPRPTAPPRPAASRSYGGLVAPILVVVLGLGALVAYRQRSRAGAAGLPAPTLAAGPAGAESAPDVPPPTLAIVATPPPIEHVDGGEGLPAADVEAANALVGKLRSMTAVGSADVEAAEALYARHPASASLRHLLEALLMKAGAQEASQRRFAEAAGDYRRAAQLDPQDVGLRLRIAEALLAAGDWSGVEAAAREALAIESTNVDALTALGFALFRQDRNREAVDVLRQALTLRDSPLTKALLARIEKGLADEKGMTEQHLSHFNVRYDGDAHEDVGREILRILERHYATLTTTLDHQPAATIPVILFSAQGYFDASGAPAWSGGAYDNVDGRIRIPIGGLTSSLTSDIDAVAIHEVTHAFIADRTKGIAPREIHEGFAQYMEGKRIASMLTPDQLKLLADGRARGVGGFYLQALSLVEYLMDIRGQGGMNDLLRTMGETGDVDEAFRRVYGQDYSATQQAWVARMGQQYGS